MSARVAGTTSFRPIPSYTTLRDVTRQEERIQVVSGSVLSVSGGVQRVLGPGEIIASPPGVAHTVGPAGGNAVEMIVEFRPPLGSRASSSAPLLWIVPATSTPRDGAALCAWRPRDRTRPSSSCHAFRSGCSEPCCGRWMGSAGRSLARAADDGPCRSRAVAWRQTVAHRLSPVSAGRRRAAALLSGGLKCCWRAVGDACLSVVGGGAWTRPSRPGRAWSASRRVRSC